ncbi:MAG: NADP-dependent oxidoreductase [Gammaproteobacteria bacterium]|nr:NADP-dependent oxidoreductase [Gammaproteobacteria bacterium]
MKTKQVHLIRRPVHASVADFTIREVELPSLRDGQVLVENLFMSVDPYMRRSMDAEAKDLPPWPIGGPLDGPSIGRVIQSRNSKYREGDIVESMSGWQEHFISNAGDFIAYCSANDAIARRTMQDGVNPEDYLGLFGIASQTAYFGMTCAATPVAGETVVISSGAGTVGMMACQIAKLKGMRVVTSAGSDDKVSWLRVELGVDHAFNYKRTALDVGLREGCPRGIDLVLENASPEHFSACLPLMNPGKLMLIAGFISIYDTGGRVNPIANFEYVLDRYVTIKAFPFMDYLYAYDRFVDDMVKWRRAGTIKFKQKVYDGIESAPEAFLSLFTGTSHGKVLVRLGM